MSLLSFSMAFISVCLWSCWTIVQSEKCGQFQTNIGGRCCDLCRPGTYMESPCSENNQSRCRPCKDGSYADKYNIFNRCEECKQCQKEFHANCNTTSGTCLCRSGFLCSSSICSDCVENKCTVGQKPKRTELSSGQGFIQYSYHCEPICPKYHYFSSTEDICKPWTQCSAIGLVEQIQGNQTHDSVCQKTEKQKQRDDRYSMYIILCIGFVLLFFPLFVFVSYICWKNIRKHDANKRAIQAVRHKASDFHLSQEESGLQLQYEFKDSIILSQLDLESYSLS